MAINPTPTLVTGGTGTLGSRVVRRLVQDDDTEVRVLSRRAAPAESRGARWFTGDLAAGRGLRRALDGVDTVVHCAHAPAFPLEEISAAAHLLTEATRARIRHFLYISIVGVDYVPLRYYRSKLAVEDLIEESGLAFTILRTAQFHELVDRLLSGVVRLPFVPVPAGFWFQPVAADEVAERLVGLARESPEGRAHDMGGPEVRSVESLAASYERIRGRQRPVKKVPIPGKTASAFRTGANLASGRPVGCRTWERHLHTPTTAPHP
ncbi:SDR family oxidoreductase [Streptomonospora salina]|uniref:Uncharacterized protein YbjT (DUF2867 family) n=1 Tax=Streptomonospora salina TaxID=104205 RepID=A0A841E6P9_9ACTN|nr:NAD(P)H-binding protein [Streptomonospora salina]MBB5998835.1 uncharacterized protein YbjT (DUF2867 family) [Streptomonospora salina]